MADLEYRLLQVGHEFARHDELLAELAAQPLDPLSNGGSQKGRWRIGARNMEILNRRLDFNPYSIVSVRSFHRPTGKALPSRS
jgi:hypothetical protein